MALQVNFGVIDDVQLNSVPIDELKLNDVTYWVRSLKPAAIVDESANTKYMSALGSSSDYDGGTGAGNDGDSVSQSAKSFSDNFSNNPDTFRNSELESGDSEIDCSPSFNTSTGSASVSFSLDQSAAPGTYNKTYTFRVYATNSYGEGTSYSSWSVTCQATVTQGDVPSTSISSQSDTDSLTSLQGTGDFSTVDFDISGQFNAGSSAIFDYRISGRWYGGSGTEDSSYITSNAPSPNSSGSITLTQTLSSSAPVGTHIENRYTYCAARNKYGWGGYAYQYMNREFIVEAVPIPVGDNATETSTALGSTLGGADYNNTGSAGNDGGNTTSPTESFSSRFTNSPTSYSKSDSYPVTNAHITAHPSLDVSTGEASVYFSISTSAPVGVHFMTYRMTVTASNSHGSSSVKAYWEVEAQFVVTQGPVPTANSSYSDPTYTNKGTINVDYGSSASVSQTSNWHGRYNSSASAPVLGYVAVSEGQITNNNVSASGGYNDTNGNVRQVHTLVDSTLTGTFYEETYRSSYAYNKYGSGPTLTWKMTSTFDVSALPPVAGSDDTNYIYTLVPPNGGASSWDLSNYFTERGSAITGYVAGSLLNDGENSAKITNSASISNGQLTITHSLNSTNMNDFETEWVKVDVHATSASGNSETVTFRSRIEFEKSNFD